MGAERDRVAGFGRLEDGLLQAGEWYRWGPYVSERQWGTVREDYSADGNAWDYLPHDHARSRASRWGRSAWPGSATSTSGCACPWHCGTPLTDDDFLVLVNAWWAPLGFVLPPARPGARWHPEIDSYDPAAPAQAAARSAGDQVTVGPGLSSSCVLHHPDEHS